MATLGVATTDTGDTVSNIIDAAWEAAESAQDSAEDYAGDAIRTAQSSIAFNHNPYDLQPDYDSASNDTRAEEKLTILDNDVNRVLGTTIPNNYDKLYKNLSQVSGIESIFEGNFDANDTMNLVSTLSAAFNDTFMFGGKSLNQSMNSVSTLIWDALTGNSTDIPFGLPATVEEALHNRTDDRASKDILRAEAEAIATFASRGFPAPPGMTMKVSEEAQLSAIGKRGDSNRDITIDQAKRGYDATQNYINTFRDIQKQGQSAFMDYLNACLKAKSAATDDINALIDAVVKLRGSVIGLYDYVDKEKEVFLREAIAEYELKFNSERIDLDAFRARIDGQINATVSAAQSMGQLAAAALGSQNTMATLAKETITGS